MQIPHPSDPPFARWFVGGTTNLCHNAVDRHLASRGDQPALICVSTETGSQRSYSFRELHAEVHFVTALPKTRSGKLLRRAIQAVCEGRDPGDLTTIDDPAALQKIQQLLGR